MTGEREAPGSQPRTVALLLIDVVDSTLLAEQLGDARTAALWEGHDDLARTLLAEVGGREIDKTDGFLLLFEEVGQTIDYVWAYHRATSEGGGIGHPTRRRPPPEGHSIFWLPEHAEAVLHLRSQLVTDRWPEMVTRTLLRPVWPPRQAA